MSPRTEIHAVCCIFAFLGVSSLSPYLSRKYLRYKFLIFVPTVIHTIITLIEICMVASNPAQFFHHGSKMGAFTDVLQVYGTLITGCVQIVENILKHSLDDDIGKMMNDIDELIFARHLCTNSPKCSFCKRRSLKPYLIGRAILIIGVALVVDTILITTIPKTEKIWQQSLIVREFTINFIRVAIFQINCYFYWLRNRLEFVQEELHRLLRIPMKSPYSGNVNMFLVQLSKMKKIYFQLWKIRAEINNRFNWTILAQVTTFFCKTAVGFYWILMRLRFQRLASMGQALFVHFTAILAILILVTEVELWTKVTGRIAKTIFHCRKINPEISRKINRFAYAIQLCPFRFSVMNFFDLKFTICASMVSATTTYMFYLFSLHPSVY